MDTRSTFRITALLVLAGGAVMATERASRLPGRQAGGDQPAIMRLPALNEADGADVDRSKPPAADTTLPVADSLSELTVTAPEIGSGLAVPQPKASGMIGSHTSPPLTSAVDRPGVLSEDIHAAGATRNITWPGDRDRPIPLVSSESRPHGSSVHGSSVHSSSARGSTARVPLPRDWPASQTAGPPPPLQATPSAGPSAGSSAGSSASGFGFGFAPPQIAKPHPPIASNSGPTSHAAMTAPSLPEITFPENAPAFDGGPSQEANEFGPNKFATQPILAAAQDVPGPVAPLPPPQLAPADQEPQLPSEVETPVPPHRQSKDPMVRAFGQPRLALPSAISLSPGGLVADNTWDDVSPEELAEFRPWWQDVVVKPMSASATTITPDSLVLAALDFSPQVAALRAVPEIRDAEITEAQAEFDPRAFLEATFDDTNEPVGNTLTTGGPPRLLEHKLGVNGGLRKKLQTGGSLEVKQSLGHDNSNSVFFVPNNQGTAQLALNFNQPLLNGAGKRVNRAQIVLAKITLNQAWDELSRDLQGHLLEVVEAYWNVYYQRSVLLQRQRNYQRAVEILKTLASRRDLDATETQIARVRAAVASRRLDVISAERDVRNVETDIRNLVQNPEMASVILELVPAEAPARIQPDLDLHASVTTAIQQRPEVNQKIRDIKASSIELDLARNDLLPVLNLVISAYADGLEGRSNVGQAFVNSLSRGGPSYSTGLLFELPVGNRAARARLRRQQAQVRLLAAQLQTTIGNVASEVERAVRDVIANYERMRSSLLSVKAAELSLAAVQRQWELMPGDSRSASLLLDEVLDKQLQLVQEELTFARSEFEYVVGLAKLRRAEGTLLQKQR